MVAGMRNLHTADRVGAVSAAEAAERVGRLRSAVERVIKGKSEAVRLATVTLLAGGHLLVEDVPGVGKTTLAQALAQAIDCIFQRIQFTSDLLPSDVIGLSVYDERKGSFEFKHGPIFANIVLADEINRTTPKTQSALLEAMAEGHVTVEGGTYPLPESQVDRFMLRIRIGYPALDVEKEILRDREHGDPLNDLRPVMSGEEVVELQRAVRNVTVDDALVD